MQENVYRVLEPTQETEDPTLLKWNKNNWNEEFLSEVFITGLYKLYSIMLY